MTVRLLRQFLEAGIEPGPALKTLNTALSLRERAAEASPPLTCWPCSGPADRPPSINTGPPVLSQAQRQRQPLYRPVLPAGLQAVREAPECTRLQLTAGSFFVMVSDGIADAGNDEWLQNLLAGWRGRGDANALVSLILTESGGRKGLEDDCAVLVLHLSSGEKSRCKGVYSPMWRAY